tara:strand:+ start:46 stop:846 length:801 start_codon:yes stop_codon:yes gene_type:complete
MPQVVAKPKKEDYSYPKLSEKIGDFIEEYLWGGDKNIEYFKRKYGENWEEKREKSRKESRTLHGILPAEDAKGLELALYAAPFLVGGLGTTLYSGRRAGITMAELMRMTPKGPAIHGGGAHPTFSFRDPLYTSMWRAEAASYPRTSRVGRELLEIEMAAEKVRKGKGMSQFDPERYPISEGYGVTQYHYDPRVGMEVPKRGSQLHAVFEPLFLKDVQRIKKYSDVRFPYNPHEYYRQTGKFLDPILGEPEDITKKLWDYWGMMKGK